MLGEQGSVGVTTMNACKKCDAIMLGMKGVFVSWKTIATMSFPMCRFRCNCKKTITMELIFNLKSNISDHGFERKIILPVADLRSKIVDARPPFGPIFLIFMQFSAKFGQIIGLRPPPLGLAPPVWEILDPSLVGIWLF